ncbi:MULTISPECIES: hypothetical protein [unclassified Microcoleus]
MTIIAAATKETLPIYLMGCFERSAVARVLGGRSVQLGWEILMTN